MESPKISSSRTSPFIEEKLSQIRDLAPNVYRAIEAFHINQSIHRPELEHSIDGGDSLRNFITCIPDTIASSSMKDAMIELVKDITESQEWQRSGKKVNQRMQRFLVELTQLTGDVQKLLDMNEGSKTSHQKRHVDLKNILFNIKNLSIPPVEGEEKDWKKSLIIYLGTDYWSIYEKVQKRVAELNRWCFNTIKPFINCKQITTLELRVKDSPHPWDLSHSCVLTDSERKVSLFCLLDQGDAASPLSMVNGISLLREKVIPNKPSRLMSSAIGSFISKANLTETMFSCFNYTINNRQVVVPVPIPKNNKDNFIELPSGDGLRLSWICNFQHLWLDFPRGEGIAHPTKLELHFQDVMYFLINSNQSIFKSIIDSVRWRFMEQKIVNALFKTKDEIGQWIKEEMRSSLPQIDNMDCLLYTSPSPRD